MYIQEIFTGMPGTDATGYLYKYELFVLPPFDFTSQKYPANDSDHRGCYTQDPRQSSMNTM